MSGEGIRRDLPEQARFFYWTIVDALEDVADDGSPGREVENRSVGRSVQAKFFLLRYAGQPCFNERSVD
nr:hypothetical protein BGP89_13505 [Luteimonas sp. JM171]